MNVLFVSNDKNLFVSGSDVRQRMHEYASTIGTLHVISRAPATAEFVQEGNLFLHPFKGSRLSMHKKVHTLITQHGIEVVSAQDPFEHGYIALKAVKGTQARLHIQVHVDFLSPWFVKGGGFRSPQVAVPLINHVRRYLADRVLPEAVGIRVVSERIRTSLLKRYEGKIPDPSVIPVAVSSVIPPPTPLPEHPFSFALITAGRLEPEKRIEDILYALARIHFSYPSVGLFIVGTGREEGKLKKLTKKLGLSNNVIFITEWRTDVLGLMQSAQAYIQASAYEGYSRTLVEAALAHIPIITTDVGLVGEVFSGYKEVLAAPVADPAALAVHIRGIVYDHQARVLLVKEAEITVKEHIQAVGNVPERVSEDLKKLI